MKEASPIPTVADPRAIDLLQRIAVAVEGLREDLRTAVAAGARSSNRPVVDARGVTNPDRLMTAVDVAGLLAIDARTLRELRHAGEAPKEIMVGHRPRWRRGDVERWISARKST